LTIACGINYAFAYVLRIVWDANLYFFVLIVLIFGFLFGLVMMDIERTIIYNGISLLLGAIIGSVLIISPTIIFGESLTTVNLAILTTTQAVSVHLLFSLALGFLGAIVGSVLGENLFLETR